MRTPVNLWLSPPKPPTSAESHWTPPVPSCPPHKCPFKCVSLLKELPSDVHWFCNKREEPDDDNLQAPCVIELSARKEAAMWALLLFGWQSIDITREFEYLLEDQLSQCYTCVDKYYELVKILLAHLEKLNALGFQPLVDMEYFRYSLQNHDLNRVYHQMGGVIFGSMLGGSGGIDEPGKYTLRYSIALYECSKNPELLNAVCKLYSANVSLTTRITFPAQEPPEHELDAFLVSKVGNLVNTVKGFLTRFWYGDLSETQEPSGSDVTTTH